jgi:hypothetical protein
LSSNPVPLPKPDASATPPAATGAGANPPAGPPANPPPAGAPAQSNGTAPANR